MSAQVCATRVEIFAGPHQATTKALCRHKSIPIAKTLQNNSVDISHKISCIRYFNNIPHIVRYGMQDEDRGRSWMKFWRCGIGFQIFVSRADVEGTRFGEKWSELNKEPRNAVGGDWVHQWELLCDCILSQALDLLDEVAPNNTRYWTLFSDYLHTPFYQVKMVADAAGGDAQGVVTKGPTIEGAYELKPLRLEDAGLEVDGLPVYKSDHLRIIDRELDWRTPPHRIEAADDRLYTLKHIDSSSRYVDTGKVVNRSLDKIGAYLQIRKHCQQRSDGLPSRIPEVLGYVTDDTTEERNLAAGIIVTDFPHFRALGDLVRDAKGDPVLLEIIKKNKDLWHAQSLRVVEDVHAREMAFGQAENEWPLINEWSIHIDNEPAAWLDPPSTITFAPESTKDVVGSNHHSAEDNEDFLLKKAQDVEAVTRLFELWLPDKLSKISAQVAS